MAAAFFSPPRSAILNLPIFRYTPMAAANSSAAAAAAPAVPASAKRKFGGLEDLRATPGLIDFSAAEAKDLYPDLTLVANDSATKYYAHRVKLGAASDVLEVALRGDSKSKSRSRTVNISTDGATLNLLLNWIYRDSDKRAAWLDVLQSDCVALKKLDLAAHQYVVSDLEVHCKVRLVQVFSEHGIRKEDFDHLTVVHADIRKIATDFAAHTSCFGKSLPQSAFMTPQFAAWVIEDHQYACLTIQSCLKWIDMKDAKTVEKIASEAVKRLYKLCEPSIGGYHNGYGSGYFSAGRVVYPESATTAKTKLKMLIMTSQHLSGAAPFAHALTYSIVASFVRTAE